MKKKWFLKVYKSIKDRSISFIYKIEEQESDTATYKDLVDQESVSIFLTSVTFMETVFDFLALNGCGF